ncbi:baseplate protein J-like protein [Vibrio phage 1.187.O._10N.286.49.F1]|nr:baseplate protein J-like protein [Vibrio phage 1.187.O._10N.286.49.F1]
MSYGVTDKGFIPKPRQAIIDQLVEDLKSELGEDFPTNPESVAGQFIQVISASIKDNWDLGSAIATTQNRQTAEGQYLDFLARIAGLSRIKESGSTGELLFTGDQNTFIPQFTACKDVDARAVITQVEFTLNRANCYQSTFSLASVTDNTEYVITVEGTEASYTSGLGSTELNVLQGIQSSLENITDFPIELDEQELTLKITYPSYNNELTTTNSANINLDSLGGLVSSESALVGSEVNFDELTINTLINSILGVQEVTNPRAFQNGRDTETDAELRIRMDEREESTGTATKPSIETALSQVSGVTSAYIVVNDTLVDDEETGVPKKHFETFIAGGDENEIAEVLHKTKSLLGQMWGDIEKTVIDQNGDTQGVKFSRPSTEYAWVRAVYSINSEEEFPADGEDRMRNAVVSYGNSSMQQGDDLEPTKFFGPLYSVSGVFIQPNIQVAITSSPTDTPAWSTVRLPVSDVNSLQFDTSRVVITT